MKIENLSELINENSMQIDTLLNNAATWLTTDTIWTIGENGNYTTLKEAWEATQNIRLTPTATLTLQLEDETHIIDDTLILHHPDGSQIKIIGNDGNPSAVVLFYTGTEYLIYLNKGHIINRLSGMTLQGTSSSGAGIYLTSGSMINLEHLIIQDFGGSCISASYNSMILSTEDSMEMQNCGAYGVVASWNSLVRIESPHIHGNGYGVKADTNSTIRINGGLIEDNTNSGVISYHSSHISADDTTSQNNGSYGYYSYFNSNIRNRDGSALNNGYSGYYANLDASIYALDSMSSNNSGYGYHGQQKRIHLRQQRFRYR